MKAQSLSQASFVPNEIKKKKKRGQHATNLCLWGEVISWVIAASSLLRSRSRTISDYIYFFLRFQHDTHLTQLPRGLHTPAGRMQAQLQVWSQLSTVILHIWDFAVNNENTSRYDKHQAFMFYWAIYCPEHVSKNIVYWDYVLLPEKSVSADIACIQLPSATCDC